MTERTWSAWTIHKELAQMAWEEIGKAPPDTEDPVTLLQIHIRKMSEILSDPAKYSQMWERVKRKS